MIRNHLGPFMWFGLMILISSSGFSEGLIKNHVENIDGVSFDWAKYGINFSGVAKQPSDGSQSFIEVEKQARSNGYYEIMPLLQNKEILPASSTLQMVRPFIVSRNSTFYKTGEIEVSLFLDLKRLVAKKYKGKKFKDPINLEGLSEQGPKALHVFLKNPAKASGIFKIMNEKGTDLYGPSFTSEASFKKNLLGKWKSFPKEALENSKKSVLKKDSNGMVIEGFWKNNRIVVSSDQWDRLGNKVDILLANSKVNLYIPH